MSYQIPPYPNGSTMVTVPYPDEPQGVWDNRWSSMLNVHVGPDGALTAFANLLNPDEGSGLRIVRMRAKGNGVIEADSARTPELNRVLVDVLCAHLAHHRRDHPEAWDAAVAVVDAQRAWIKEHGTLSRVPTKLVLETSLPEALSGLAFCLARSELVAELFDEARGSTAERLTSALREAMRITRAAAHRPHLQLPPDWESWPTGALVAIARPFCEPGTVTDEHSHPDVVERLGALTKTHREETIAVTDGDRSVVFTIYEPVVTVAVDETWELYWEAYPLRVGGDRSN